MDREEIEKSVQACYSTWGKTYYDEYYGPNAPYPPVHTNIVRTLVEQSGARTLLDAGCGPASFLRDIFDLDLDLYGFDLTKEMVEEGKRIFDKNKRPANQLWQGSVLDGESFRYPGHQKLVPYDAVVCAGVLPHIPKEQDFVVVENLHAALKTGGLAVLEARNQLFSLFTMNRYSYEFIAEELIDIKRLKAKAKNDQLDLGTIFEDMKKQFRMDLPPIRKGKEGEPGYDEVLSRTHNPLVLKEQFQQAGFENVRVLFYHYHSLPPMLGGKVRDFFMRESIAMENAADWRGYFMASAFFVVGNRRGNRNI